MTREEARQQLRSFFPEKGKPFIVELELTEDLTDDKTTDMCINLMDSMMNSKEILPGLKVARVYRQVETTDSIHVENTSEKVFKIQETIKENLDKLNSNIEDLKQACKRLGPNFSY